MEKQKQEAFRNFLTQLPKTEIHLHLEGLAGIETIWKLITRNNLSLAGISNKADLINRYSVESLDEFINLFIEVIQNCFQRVEDMELLFNDAESYLTRNNIRYAEIFFAPSKFVSNGLQFDRMMETLDKGARYLKKQADITVQFLIDVSRTTGVDNAKNNLEQTLRYKPSSVIGIGLGGSEKIGPARDFQEVFEKARENGLQVVAHAGEDIGPESIWDALQFLNVSRIGHGISAIQDEKLMEYLAEKKIPLEICPTSNLFTRRFVKILKEHPIRPFFDRGMTVTVNTDDPAIFNIDLIDEYMNLLIEGLFSYREIVDIVKNGLFATFLPEKEKKAWWKKIEKMIAASQFA